MHKKKKHVLQHTTRIFLTTPLHVDRKQDIKTYLVSNLDEQSSFVLSFVLFIKLNNFNMSIFIWGF
jgi:hypothetical protein